MGFSYETFEWQSSGHSGRHIGFREHFLLLLANPHEQRRQQNPSAEQTRDPPQDASASNALAEHCCSKV